MVDFLAAIPRVLADEIRNLPGRFDGHTIEAVHLFFCAESDSPEESSLKLALGQTQGEPLLGNLGALRSLWLANVWLPTLTGAESSRVLPFPSLRFSSPASHCLCVRPRGPPKYLPKPLIIRLPLRYSHLFFRESLTETVASCTINGGN